ncbi:MAG: hypothetical protein D6773_13505 [Alphaproteobacteria bacterium]|nr:MAG: hypothetical protein D6773_13505 [Alphaproteobacteria bacterium]
MSLGNDFDRADRRLLEYLNAGGVPDSSVPRSQLDRLAKEGLIEETSLGQPVITARGQLQLARWRFRNLPKPRYVTFSYKKPRPNIWNKLFR